MKTASRILVAMFATLTTAASVLAGAPDATAKMSGNYGGSARPSYRRVEVYRAPVAVARVPARVETGRTFSYEPTRETCSVPTAAAATKSAPARRFSYEPTAPTRVYRTPTGGGYGSWAPAIHGADAKMKGNY